MKLMTFQASKLGEPDSKKSDAGHDSEEAVKIISLVVGWRHDSIETSLVIYSWG